MRGSTTPYFQLLVVSERNIDPSTLSLSIPFHASQIIHTIPLLPQIYITHSPVIIIFLILHNLLRMLNRVKYNLATTNNPSLFHFYFLALLLLQIAIFIIISLNPIPVVQLVFVDDFAVGILVVGVGDFPEGCGAAGAFFALVSGKRRRCRLVISLVILQGKSEERLTYQTKSPKHPSPSRSHQLESPPSSISPHYSQNQHLAHLAQKMM
jgi:hypothetical protein